MTSGGEETVQQRPAHLQGRHPPGKRVPPGGNVREESRPLSQKRRPDAADAGSFFLTRARDIIRWENEEKETEKEARGRGEKEMKERNPLPYPTFRKITTGLEPLKSILLAKTPAQHDVPLAGEADGAGRLTVAHIVRRGKYGDNGSIPACRPSSPRAMPQGRVYWYGYANSESL